MKNEFKNIDNNIESQEIETFNYINDITSETLTGWSNICFNDTIDYYNDYHNHNKDA